MNAIQIVANALKLNEWELLSDTRKADVVMARMVAWSLMRESGLTYQICAHLMNKNSHTSVIYSVKRLKELIELKDCRVVQAMKLVNEYRAKYPEVGDTIRTCGFDYVYAEGFCNDCVFGTNIAPLTFRACVEENVRCGFNEKTGIFLNLKRKDK